MNSISSVLSNSDLLIEIFSYLPTEALSSIASVCKKWSEACNHPLGWKRRFLSLASQEIASKFTLNPSLSFKEAYRQLIQFIEIISNYPRALIEAFGGAEKILELPLFSSDESKRVIKEKLTSSGNTISFCYISPFKLEEISAPMVRGKAKNGEHFCALKLVAKISGKSTILSFFQPSCDSSPWIRQQNRKNQPGNFFVRFPAPSEFKQIENLKNGTDPKFQLSN